MDALFGFLFNYRPIVFERGALALGVPWVVFVGLLAAVALAIPTLLRYSDARGKTTRRDRVILMGLRAGVLSLLVFSLCRPALVVSTVVPQQSFVGVLLDDSLSMRIADGDDGARSDYVGSTFGTEGALRKALEERFKLRYIRFSDTASRVEGPEALRFDGQQTHVGSALDRARQELASVPLAGLVVVSDGADNADGALTDALLALRAEDVPVYAVGLGRERFDRDLELSRVETPRAVLRGTTLAADVQLTQRGLAGERVQLLVEDGGRVVHTEEVELPVIGEVGVRVHATATEPGPRIFTFRVAPVEGEQVLPNNRRDVLVQVADREEKVLYFEGEPRYEAKFVRRAVDADENLRVVTLLRTSENKFYRVGVDDGEELADGFPKTREELFRYRGLILGSVEASFFTRDQLRMIAEFVSERGGGLLMLGSRFSFSEGGYAETPVADALPVVLEAAQTAGGRDDPRYFSEVKVQLTPFGRAHGVTQLAETEDASAERWQGLPPLSVVNAVGRTKPGAATLLTGSMSPGDTAQVVLAYQRYGSGKALAFTVQDSWQWQMHAEISVEDRTHEGLWQQLLRWLVADVPGQVRLTTQSDRVSPGRSVRLRAEVRDDRFIKVNDARVVALVRSPSGEERELPMEWSVERDGEYEARIATDEPGFYEVRVEATRADQPLGPPATTWVQAVPLDTEYFGAERRSPLLQRLAEETGGRFYTPETAHTLAEDISYTGSGTTVTERKELWNMPALFLAALGLAFAEWAFRKWKGLL